MYTLIGVGCLVAAGVAFVAVCRRYDGFAGSRTIREAAPVRAAYRVPARTPGRSAPARRPAITEDDGELRWSRRWAAPADLAHKQSARLVRQP